MDRLGTVARLLAVALATSFVACQQSTPPADAPKVSGQATETRPAPAEPSATAPSTSALPTASTSHEPSPPPLAAATAPALAMPASDPPPGPLYFCEVGATRAPVELDARVDALCRRHPQMGPCQYGRDACRARGGRVFTARGEEVTPAVEAEYDRVVRRVRLQAEGGPPAR